MSNGLDPDQDQHFVTSDLGPICLQRLSLDKSPLARKKSMFIIAYVLYKVELPVQSLYNTSPYNMDLDIT